MRTIYSRRNFFKQSGIISAGLLLNPAFAGSAIKKDSSILLVSGWQDVNIGDIAHTPGLLHVLETFLPEARITLWKKSGYNDEVSRLLKNNFPKVKVIYGAIDADKNVSSRDVLDAFREADLMIHGSGPGLVGADNLAAWIKYNNKPFGVFGTTLQSPGEYHVEILKKASFIFTRETLSIEHLTKAGISGNHIAFAPDATFFLNIFNDTKAAVFLRSKGLEEKKFICVIPRLRYTPYHLFNPNRNGWSDDKIRQVEETNLKYKETDHAKLREAMVAWVRETGQKVLVCPEMTYQVEIMDELLIDPLPDDVKPFVVKRGYWLPDEAASIYAKAHTVLSFECHSPIIAAAVGTPFFYLRQPEDTIKGQMYYDLGFKEWTFEIDRTSGKQIAECLRGIWKEYQGAQAILAAAMKRVSEIYKERCEYILSVLSRQ